MTCRRLHQTIAESVILQYRIAQLAAKVTDTGHSDLTVKDRLELLYRFEKNWTTLDFVSNHQFDKRNSYAWELVQGVLAFGFGRTRNHPCGIDFTELPSSIRGTTGRTWRHDDLGVNIRDFTIDPGQDLAVIIERPILDTFSRPLRAKYSVHLLTMSTGLPHPKSGFSDGPLFIALRHEYYSFTFQLTGNILIVLCLNTRTPPYLEQDHIYIWDWTCGELLLHKATSSKTIRFGSFSILSPEHLLIPSFDPVHGSKHTPRLDIYKIPTRKYTDSIDPAPLLTLQLPLLHEDARVVSMLTRTDPLEGFDPTSTGDRIFVSASSCSLIVVELGIRSANNPFCCMLFVHASMLLSTTLTSMPNTVLPWESWGPSSSRLVETKAEAIWIGYVYGNRYVKPLPKFSWHGRGVCPSYLQVWDFNPTPLPFIDDSSGTSTIRWVTEASLISKTKRVFADHVRTCLRYREITSSRTYHYDGIIIDQDILIGLCSRKESGRTVQGIEVLCI